MVGGRGGGRRFNYTCLRSHEIWHGAWSIYIYKGLLIIITLFYEERLTETDNLHLTHKSLSDLNGELRELENSIRELGNATKRSSLFPHRSALPKGLHHFLLSPSN